MSDNNDDVDEHRLLYESSDDEAAYDGFGDSDDDDDDFIFLDHAKGDKEEIRANRRIGKKRKRSLGDSPALLSEGYSFDDLDVEDSPLLKPEPLSEDEEDNEEDDVAEHKDVKPIRERTTGVTLKKFKKDVQEYRSMLRAITYRQFGHATTGDLALYPPSLSTALTLRANYCWPWRDYPVLSSSETAAVGHTAAPVYDAPPEVRSISEESPWTQVPVADAEKAELAGGSSATPLANSASDEDGYMAQVREELANVTARSFQIALAGDPRVAELNESSASVQMTAAVVTEAVESLLKGTLQLRGVTGPPGRECAKTAGDWETVVHAAECLKLPTRVIERTKLRLYADREKEELMRFSCFPEMQWVPIPGGLNSNRLVPRPAVETIDIVKTEPADDTSESVYDSSE
mmetsp:Transcript_21784/g.85139  ORF Transcript_21784/g.85139 Transcript_21784/m.85139 type:complete len:404 (-) Transcript_21784:22-1233(-)